ncbi:hypothetical protein [Desulfoplanes sp.]
MNSLIIPKEETLWGFSIVYRVVMPKMRFCTTMHFCTATLFVRDMEVSQRNVIFGTRNRCAFAPFPEKFLLPVHA